MSRMITYVRMTRRPSFIVVIPLILNFVPRLDF